MTNSAQTSKRATGTRPTSILAAGAPKDPDDNRLWPRYAELVRARGARPRPSCAVSEDPAVRAFALDVVRYLYRSGDHASSQSFAEGLIDAVDEGLRAGRPALLAAQRHLGNALRELGRYSEAYALDEERWGEAGKLLGERHTRHVGADELLRRRTCGPVATSRLHASWTRNRWTCIEAVLGSEDPQTLRVMTNLALDHGLNSDYVAARDLYRAHLCPAERGDDRGVSPTEVLSSWIGLARAAPAAAVTSSKHGTSVRTPATRAARGSGRNTI